MIEPFAIRVEEAVLDDLGERLRRTRWPPDAPGAPWEQGIDVAYLRGFVRDWAHFDWRAEEAALNRVPQFRARIDGVAIHFVHQRAPGRRGIPLILTHGWPSAFVEYLPLVPLLTDPAAHGIDGPAFDVVIPSLPGYGFSERPPRANYRTVAALWHGLMDALGYGRYGAAGGDFGAGVASYMAVDAPERMIGVHLSTPELSPVLDRAQPLSEAERAWLRQRDAWDAVERGYSSIQSTRPQTVGVGLNDSPAGLAAWLLEKWRSWSDCGGDLDSRFERRFLITLVTLYWITSSITTSMRDYFDNRWHAAPLGPGDFIDVPTGVANFCRQHVFEGEPPREWYERLYRVVRFTPMPSGGHFGAAEEPLLLARDLAAFFAAL